jgi:hypothetical protein
MLLADRFAFCPLTRLTEETGLLRAEVKFDVVK